MWLVLLTIMIFMDAPFQNVPVACVPTGVKHLHHKAQDFDIGVYFEANGHGTVTFSDNAHSVLREKATATAAGTKLEQLMNIINETVGDAISDMLLVESILHVKGWSMVDWSKAYTDIPNRLMKVKNARNDEILEIFHQKATDHSR